MIKPLTKRPTMPAMPKLGKKGPVKSDKGPVAQTPIIPPQSVSRRALSWVITIMTFLACLTFGSMTLVQQTANGWRTEISREATIQIRPAENLDIEKALERAQAIAEEFDGVTGTKIVSSEAAARLLEPWLGSDLNLEELPVPQLVVVTINTKSPPNFTRMRAMIEESIPAASLDDHRTYVDRLVSMARTTVFIGLMIFLLVLTTTILTVVFATRGAMTGAGHIIEVLHYVGAEAPYIARQFRNHFLWTGIKGACIGGLSAISLFMLISIWSSVNLATPQGDQAAALFGQFAIGWIGYLGLVGVVALVAVLTAATSHFTVITFLDDLHQKQTGT